jgi:peptide/nickel transport system substrate-binding protein
MRHHLCGLVFLSALAMAGAPALAATNVLVLAKAEDPPTCDPGIEISNNGYTLIFPTYERLVRYKGGTTDIEGELADSWSLDADGTSWIVKLKPGHKFEDGSPVDAAAVKFSLDRTMKLNQGPAGNLPSLKSVTVIDPLTVRFEQTSTFGPFMSTLATVGASVVNPKAMEHEKDGDMAKGWLAEHTAGSGPYKITSWERNQSIVLDKNPSYVGPAPKLSRIVVKIVRELSARRLQVEHGDADIIDTVPVDQAIAMKDNPKLVVESNPSFQVFYVYMNNKKPFLDNVKVRQALSYAVDYQGIVKDIMKGQAVQMRGPVPEGMWAHDPNGFQYSYDPEKAKALLKEAGVNDLKLTYTFSQAASSWEPVGLAMQASFAKVGVKLDLQNVADVTKRQMQAAGNTEMSPGNWTPDFADPYMFMNYWFDPAKKGGPGNRSFYENPKVTELITKAAQISDQAEREKLYIEAQRISTQDAPYIYLFQSNDIFVRRAAVQGFVYNPMLLLVYNFADMSKTD